VYYDYETDTNKMFGLPGIQTVNCLVNLTERQQVSPEHSSIGFAGLLLCWDLA